jgi:hypothetical protein
MLLIMENSTKLIFITRSFPNRKSCMCVWRADRQQPVQFSSIVLNTFSFTKFSYLLYNYCLLASMNLIVLLLQFERQGLVVSWRVSYDQNATLVGMITRVREDSNR